MAPRKYSLGKRAAAVEETRQRILEAAAALFLEQGILSTSMQDVARRADVAPGTVLNHFSTNDDLAQAVVTRLTTTLRVPTEEVFHGLRTLQERTEKLARELAAFYRRSEPWYRVYERERDKVPALAEGETLFFEGIDRLVRLALGPLSRNETVVSVLMALTNPSVFGVLRGRGLSAEDAANLMAEVLQPWLERKLVEGGEK